MIKALIITIVCISIILLTGRYLKGVEINYSLLLNDAPEQKHYTHQFKNFSLTNTNKAGAKQSTIASPQTKLLVAEQKTFMETPTITMYRDQQAPMVITSDSAEIYHQDNITQLDDNVRVTMPDQKNNSIVMTTEKLTLNNSTHQANTDLPATIVHGKGNMHGTGLEFNPHTQQIKFLNKVRGIYEY